MRIVSLGLNYFKYRQFDARFLAENGVDAVRLNFSHVDYGQVRECLAYFRKDCPQIRILQDLQGQKWRVAKDFILGEKRVGKGERVVFCPKDRYLTLQKSDPHKVHIPIEMEGDFSILKDVKSLSMKDGASEFRVVSNMAEKERTIVAEALDQAVVRAEKSINIPEAARRDLSAMTLKDKQDIEWGIRNRADIICLSFVNQHQDIVEFRDFVDSLLPKGQKRPALWAKIETRDGCLNFEAILEQADGVMLGRGDLLPEIGRFAASVVQYDLLHKFKRSKAKGKDFIVATHVLDSLMTGQATHPSIANLNDISRSIQAGATGFMLTNEVGYGKQPKAAIRILNEYLEFLATK